MDNKTEYFTLKEDGVIGWIENCPLAPVKSFAAAHYVSAEMEYQVAVLEYNEALQSAISNAIPVVNHDEVMMRIFKAHPSQHLIHGTPYPLQCHVEKKEFCEDFDKEGRPFDCPFNGSERHKTVALVTFSEPSAGVEETQEELPEVIKFLLGEAPLDGHWFGDSFARGGKFWWRAELRKLFEHENRKNK